MESTCERECLRMKFWFSNCQIFIFPLASPAARVRESGLIAMQLRSPSIPSSFWTLPPGMTWMISVSDLAIILVQSGVKVIWSMVPMLVSISKVSCNLSPSMPLRSINNLLPLVKAIDWFLESRAIVLIPDAICLISRFSFFSLVFSQCQTWRLLSVVKIRIRLSSRKQTLRKPALKESGKLYSSTVVGFFKLVGNIFGSCTLIDLSSP